MSKQTTLAEREQYVVKANDLIRKTRYKLTAQQQKIILYTISKIKPTDDANTEYTFDIGDFVKVTGRTKNKDYYTRIKKDFKELSTPVWIKTINENGKPVERMIAWFKNEIEITPGDRTIKLSFNKYMQPYLFALKNQYTQYRLEHVLAFEGKFTIRLYEILRSYTTQYALENRDEKDVVIPLEELKYELDVNGYERWTDLNNNVLKPAVKEINERADDIHIEYHPMSEKGRTITKINFVITAAGLRQHAEAVYSRNKKLNGGGTTRK